MWLLLLACAQRDGLTILVDAEGAALLGDFVAFLEDERVQLEEVDDPSRKKIRGLHVAILPDTSCTECYTISQSGERYVIQGGFPLGVQYGLAALLEDFGYRFGHPMDPFSPESLVAPTITDTTWAPEMERRGLHMHTLHPIEGTAAFWMDDDSARARRVVDWVIKNQGNHLQWVALDDILDPATYSAWSARTADRIAYAHQRGLTVGVGIQLFGSGNLQRAYDLVDDTDNMQAELNERIGLVTAGLDWDLLNLSFGEFSGEDPDTFIASANAAYTTMQIAAPGIEVPAVIHVGNYPELQVSYNGEELLYYFLVDYADPGIKPWIHTVMFYNLFEDAGGAYAHEEFDQHRAFLLEHLAAGEPVGYFPESAYWVAFDNPIPLYLPLYVRSRWVDMAEIAAAGPSLQDHVLFSSGWEWGFWLNDIATLRMNAELQDWTQVITEQFAPLPDGKALAETVISLTALQHTALIEQRLMPWLAGRDALMDVGYTQGIISQPERPAWSEIPGLSADERATLRTSVVTPLQSLATETAALSFSPPDHRYGREIADGIEINALRASFMASLLDGVLTAADGGDPSAAFAEAETTLTAATAVVARRHADFHDPDPRWTQDPWTNPTIYQYGYLAMSDQLCFWTRDLLQARAAALGTSEDVPTCVL